MASEGIGYFPLGCVLDEKFQLIEAEYGLKGFAIVVKLFQRIYGGHGYYCEWNDDIALIFAKQQGVSQMSAHGSVDSADASSESGRPKNLIDQVVEASIRRGIFNADLYQKYGILTSHGIQNIYLRSVRNRTEIKLLKEYLLLSDAEIKGNVVINAISDVRNSNSDVRNRQRKRKEKKGNNSNRRETADDPPLVYREGSFEIGVVDRLIQSCLTGFPKSKVPETLEEKQKWAVEIDRMKRLDKLSEEEILQALNFAVSDQFWKSNIRSAKKFREKFETLHMQSKQRGVSNIAQHSNGFNNFAGRSYDMNVLEAQLIEH